MQLAEVLLQGLFDSANGGYVPQHERLLAGIARQLWPLLGISAPVADALWAWVHFREVGPHHRGNRSAEIRQPVSNASEEELVPSLWHARLYQSHGHACRDASR